MGCEMAMIHAIYEGEPPWLEVDRYSTKGRWVLWFRTNWWRLAFHVSTPWFGFAIYYHYPSIVRYGIETSCYLLGGAMEGESQCRRVLGSAIKFTSFRTYSEPQS